MAERSLATRLRVLRAERRLTLREVEEITGVAKETISDIERGARHPQDRTLAKLAEGYGVPIEELIEEPEVPLAEAPSQRASSGETQTGPLSFEESGDLLLLGEAVGAKRPSLEDFSEDLLTRTLVRFVTVRRKLRDSDSEGLRRGGGDLTDSLIVAVSEEFDRRLAEGLAEGLAENLAELEFEVLAELYRLSDSCRESMPRLYAVTERALARSGARAGIGGMEERREEASLSARRGERSSERGADEASEAG